MGLLYNDDNKKSKKSGYLSFNSSNDKPKKSYTDTLQTRINNYETRLNAAGVEVPEQKREQSFLLKALDIIDRPRNAIVNAIQDTKTGENSALKGALEGFTGKEHAYTSDLLDPNMNKYARAGLGFVGDVLLDPTTYLTLGAGGVAKTALKEGAEAAAENVGKRTVLKFAGQEIADVTPIGKALGNSALGRATAPLRQGIADTFQPIFNTRYVMGGAKMLPEERQAIQGVVDDIAFLPQHIKGGQQIALDEMQQAWKGVTPQAAEEATRLIESPIENDVINFKYADSTATKAVAEANREFDIPKGADRVVYDNSAMARPEIQLADKVSNALSGTSVIPVKMPSDMVKVQGFMSNKKIFLNKDMEDPATYVTLHEATHRMAETHPEHYAKMQEIAVNNLKDDHSKLIQRYQKRGYEITDMPDEFFSDIMAEMLHDKTFIGKLRDNAPEVIQPLLQVIDEVIQKVRLALSNDDSVLPFIKNLERLRGELAPEYRGYLNTVKGQQDATAGFRQGVAAKQGEVRFKQGEVGLFSPQVQATGSMEGRQAADIAKHLTEQTAAKDMAAGVEFDIRDNYIKHLYKEDKSAQALWQEFKKTYSGGTMKPNTKASFQKERKFDTYKDFEEWAKDKGVPLTPIYDARILTAVREMEGVYKRASTAMYNKIANAGEFVVKEAYDKDGKKLVPNDWVEVPGVKQLKGKAVHPEVARHLERFNSVFNSDVGLRNLSTMFNSAQNVWKGLVTTSVPFHIRNAMGNVYNNFLAGVVNPQIYTMAAGVQRGIDGTFVLSGKDYTSKSLLKEFRKQGLEGFGQYQGETLKTLTREAETAFGTNKLGVKNLNPLSGDFALVKGSRYVGDKIETNAKLTHFIDRLAKGDTPEQAAESVRKYLFDYSDLTQAEKKIRTVIPFYTWTRKNLPLQLKSLVTQPGKPNAINKLVQNMKNTSGMDEETTPEWMENELAVPLWIKKDGTQVYLSPNLPISNLNMIGIGGDKLRSVAGMLSPLVKAPIEFSMNKQFFSGQPIEKYPGANANYAGMQIPAKTAYLLNQLGAMPRSAASIAQDLSNQNPNGESLIPAAPDRSAAYDVLLGSLRRDINPERQKVLNLLDRDEQLSNYRRLVEEVQGIEVPSMQELEQGGSTAKKKGKGYLF